MEISSRVRSAVLFSVLSTIKKAKPQGITLAQQGSNQVVMNITGAELAKDIADSICKTIDITPKRMKIIMSITVNFNKNDEGAIIVENFKNLNSCLDLLMCDTPAQTINDNDENWRYFWQVFAFQAMSKELFEFMTHQDNKAAMVSLIESYLNHHQSKLAA